MWVLRILTKVDMSIMIIKIIIIIITTTEHPIQSVIRSV